MRTILLALLLVPVALASHGNPPAPGPCPADGLVELRGEDGQTAFYLDLDASTGPALYQETNGVYAARAAGLYLGATVLQDLQLGGSNPYLPDDNEVFGCGDPLVVPDLRYL